MMQTQTILPAERRAYTVREFSAAYRISRSHIYELMKRGALRTVRVGGKRLIPVEAGEALLNGGAHE